MTFALPNTKAEAFYKEAVLESIQRAALRFIFGLPQQLQRALLSLCQNRGHGLIDDPSIQMMVLLGSLMPAFDREVSPTEVRAFYRQALRLVGPAPDPDIEVTRVTLPGEAGDIAASLYWRGPRQDQPCLIFLHGGAFIFGDIESYDALCRSIAAQSGVAVLSIEYRLAPEYPFPAALEDSLAAYHAWRMMAPDFGIDPNRLAIGGDSAGAQLAATACIILRDLREPLPCYQWLLYPPTEFLPEWAPGADPVEPGEKELSLDKLANGLGLDNAALRWFARQYVPGGGDYADPRLSPLRARRHDGLPPALVLTAGLDPLCDQGKAYAAALSNSGVEVQHLHYPNAFHGFIGCAGILESGRTALSEAAGALGRACGVSENAECYLEH
jgi:acetyl esterase